MKKLPYTEGTWFAVPLRTGGYSLGVVARAASRGKVILAYLFKRRLTSPPKLDECVGLEPNEATMVVRIGDLGLIRGDWPIIGIDSKWMRSMWSLPQFLRVEELSNRAWKVTYSNDDPNHVISEEPWRVDDMGLTEDVLYGAGAVEIALSK
ncbi:MAG: hypothetical protein IPL52_08845 [Flavobacteriales bacterium]|nr:hypothetical protein [Flavobacteriales bacterium]